MIDIEHLRIDSTVVRSHIAPPSDSQLLNDGIRVLSRMLAKAKDETGIRFSFRDQRKKTKSLAFRIFNAGEDHKNHLYPELLHLADLVMKQVARALDKITSTDHWCSNLIHYRDLLAKVIDQTTRRVMNGEKVPSSDKVVSVFESHTDIIVKGFRNIQYGHKINLSSDASGFFTHCSIEMGKIAMDVIVPIPLPGDGDGYKMLAQSSGYSAPIVDNEVDITKLSSNQYTLASGDFNGDGISDALVQSTDGSLLSFTLANSSTHETPYVLQTFASIGTDTHTLTVADLNQDGRDDIRLSNKTTKQTSFMHPMMDCITTLGKNKLPPIMVTTISTSVVIKWLKPLVKSAKKPFLSMTTPSCAMANCTNTSNLMVNALRAANKTIKAKPQNILPPNGI